MQAALFDTSIYVAALRRGDDGALAVRRLDSGSIVWLSSVVLEELYARSKDTPLATDLPALWRGLGIDPEDGTVKLREDAPLAKIRDAIMRAPLDSTPADSDRSTP